MEDATILNIGGINYRIVDASVPSWAKQNTKPSYAANEISGLATVATSGSYNDLTNKPTIPAALNVTEAHKAAVMAMDSVEDIENYDITQGYPQKLNLSTEWLRSQS